MRYEPFDTGGYEALLIDALAEFPGLCLSEFYELGELGCYHAIFEDWNGAPYEIDVAPELCEALDDETVVQDLTRRISEIVGIDEWGKPIR